MFDRIIHVFILLVVFCALSATMLNVIANGPNAAKGIADTILHGSN